VPRILGDRSKKELLYERPYRHNFISQISFPIRAEGLWQTMVATKCSLRKQFRLSGFFQKIANRWSQL
jgi:hypothetical protein